MNDLNLRVSGGIGEKVKKPLAPISMPYWSFKESGDENDEFCMKFLKSSTADDQLRIMKQYLNNHKDLCQEKMVEFLVLLFWDADSKHPVKGFLKKHIAASNTLREPFTKCLTSVITDEITGDSFSTCYGDYTGVVTRLDACIEKFAPGATAVSSLEIEVATYLVNCMECCLDTLGNGEKEQDNDKKSEPLAPTEINKIYDLVHLTLRLLLYIIQKVTDNNRSKLSTMFWKIRSITADLMSGKDVPMDTKSVSGIIDFTLHVFENGPESWIELFEKQPAWTGTVALCMYSAVATAVPADALLQARVGDQPAVLLLTDSILDIGDRYSSDSSHMLAVARTLLAIGKSLARAPAAVAGPLLGRLARFCWAHLEHHLDSVRHLAAMLLGLVVAAAVRIEEGGDPGPLDSIYCALPSLGGGRGYFAALGALAAHSGARLAARLPALATQVVAALGTQPVQALASNLLETLLKNQMLASSPKEVYENWITVILDRVKNESDPTVLNILEKILAKAVQWDDRLLQYILPEQRALSSYEGSDLKCVLLVLGVVRKSGVAYKGFSQDELSHAAYDADDEIRILSLSLVAESPRSTQPFSAEELSFVLHFLDYNINAQSPNFRQLVLANMKKILKRLEDSFKVLQRHEDEHAAQISCYLAFVEDLRSQCFASLVAGANYGRRCCALQVLSWTEALQLTGHSRTWTKERAETLHNALDDSYENNKILALDVLGGCPADILYQSKSLSTESYVEEAMRHASSLKPTDCVSASYKLLLYLRNEPATGETPERCRLVVLRGALSRLAAQAAAARRLVRVRAAPMFGLLHVINRLVSSVDPSAIAGNAEWSSLVAEVIEACGVVNSRVACVVNAASPEGLMPDEGPEGPDDCAAEGDRPVTAQMVLLCAWRAVKETSLLLGALVSHLTLEGEDPQWTLSARQVEGMGDTLIGLLASVKHRGAFEQAYVGFTVLLGRLWKCRSPRLHQLPLQWYSSIERDFLLPPVEEGRGEHGATRRGAGLPFMIQALVTTELAAEASAPRGRLLTRCLELCLRAAAASNTCSKDAANASSAENASDVSSSTSSECSAAGVARAHLVLRSLARHAEPPAGAVAAALRAAVRGAGADTWTERNSSTLLFSALIVRIFGVQRGKDAHRLALRNRMTGRIFFLRYPDLHDFLLEELKSANVEGELRPSLFPTLLLLSRLYPSALEGTVSNLKRPPSSALPDESVRRLSEAKPSISTSPAIAIAAERPPSSVLPDESVRRLSEAKPSISTSPAIAIAVELSGFLRPVCRLAGARDVAVRELAARAAAPLVTPDQYIPHMESLFSALGDQKIKSNLCHGILCQLSVLLECPPPKLPTELASTAALAAAARGPCRLLARRCRLLADRFLAVLNLLLLRFPGCLYNELIAIGTHLEDALFNTTTSKITSGREIYLANAVYMYIIILTLTYRKESIISLVLKCLKHADYEVKLSALNYILMLHNQNDDFCNFLEHLNQITDKNILHKFHEDEKYVKLLCDASKHFYLECQQKALKALTYTPNTQKDIVNTKLGTTGELSYEVMLRELLDSAENAHANLRSIYLQSALTLVSKSRNVSGSILSVAKAILAACAPSAGDADIVADYFQTELVRMLSILPKDPADQFEYDATMLASAAMLLEDDCPRLRRRAARAVSTSLGAMKSAPDRQAVSAARAARGLRQYARDSAHGAPLLLVLAALDFRAGVAAGGELGDECRVFDQNETHNVFLEEFTWTRDCALKIKEIHDKNQELLGHTYTVEQFVRSLANDDRYRPTIEKLCIENVVDCLSMKAKSSHPKVELFFEVLKQ